MSPGLICDACHVALELKPNGDDEFGERSAWITIGTTFQTFDACTVACAEVLLAGPVHDAADQALEVVSEIVRAVREGREADEGEATP